MIMVKIPPSQSNRKKKNHDWDIIFLKLVCHNYYKKVNDYFVGKSRGKLTGHIGQAFKTDHSPVF